MAWNTDGCFVSHASVKRHTPNWSCSRKTTGPLPRLNYEMDPVGKQCMSRHCITLWLAWPQWDSGTSLRKRTTRKSFPFAWWSWLVRKYCDVCLATCITSHYYSSYFWVCLGILHRFPIALYCECSMHLFFFSSHLLEDVVVFAHEVGHYLGEVL